MRAAPAAPLPCAALSSARPRTPHPRQASPTSDTHPAPQQTPPHPRHPSLPARLLLPGGARSCPGPVQGQSSPGRAHRCPRPVQGQSGPSRAHRWLTGGSQVPREVTRMPCPSLLPGTALVQCQGWSRGAPSSRAGCSCPVQPGLERFQGWNSSLRGCSACRVSAHSAFPGRRKEPSSVGHEPSGSQELLPSSAAERTPGAAGELID